MWFRIVLELLYFCYVIADTPGVLNLDYKSFDKVVNAFDVALVMFSGDHGTVDYLEQLADAISGDSTAIIAQVKLETAAIEPPMPDYDYPEYPNEGGEAEPINGELADRYEIRKTNWPEFRLFKRELSRPLVFKYPDDSEDPVAAFKSFLESHGVFLGKEGCLRSMKGLVEKFFSGAQDTAELVSEAKAKVEKYDSEMERRSAKVYVTYLERVAEKGHSFVSHEQERLRRLLDADMSPAKRKEVQNRANIIESFKLSSPKQEL